LQNILLKRFGRCATARQRPVRLRFSDTNQSNGVNTRFIQIHQRMLLPNQYIVHLVTVILTALLLASCEEERSTDTRPLTYWSSNNNGEIAFSRLMVDRWNAQQPDRQVSFQPVPEGQSSEEIILAAVVGKTTPDIYSNIWQGLVEFYSRSGILVALDTLPGFTEFLSARCDSATIAEITSSDGHIYQIPWKVNPIVTIYNRKVWAALGIDSLPMTYSAYLKAAEQFSQDTDGDGYVDQWFGNTSVKLAWYQRLFNFYTLYLAASGGMPLIKDNKANFNNAYAVGVFSFLQTLYQRNYFSRQVESAGQDLFVAGRYASKWTGPWEIEYLEKFKRPGFEYGFAPIPVPDGHQGPVYTYGDPKSIVIFNTCKHPREAFAFIRSMLSEEADLRFLEMTRQLPRRQKLDQLPAFRAFFAQNPHMQHFAAQARHLRGADISPVMIEVFDIISQEYEACVLYQQKTPEQAVADAARAVDLLLQNNP